MQKLTTYLRIREAAQFLGVAPNTVRLWGRNGKITEYRHPINNYRLFKRSDLAQILRQIERSANKGSRKPK